MKKILFLATSAFLVSSFPALAEDVAGTTTPAPEQKVEKTEEEKDKRGHGGIIGKADQNGDGVLTKQEFLVHSEQMFADMDTNKDGQITMEEQKARQDKWREEMKEKRAQRKAEKQKSLEESKAAEGVKEPEVKSPEAQTPVEEKAAE